MTPPRRRLCAPAEAVRPIVSCLSPVPLSLPSPLCCVCCCRWGSARSWAGCRWCRQADPRVRVVGGCAHRHRVGFPIAVEAGADLQRDRLSSASGRHLTTPLGRLAAGLPPGGSESPVTASDVSCLSGGPSAAGSRTTLTASRTPLGASQGQLPSLFPNRRGECPSGKRDELGSTYEPEPPAAASAVLRRRCRNARQTTTTAPAARYRSVVLSGKTRPNSTAAGTHSSTNSAATLGILNAHLRRNADVSVLMVSG